ncbi:hypothetical protein MMARE11_p00850 (plasmid) [Mycobacterium marinum E11]|nr:hypothetical protein [Mycobacterium marinum]GJO56183.1 hypothetical protein NJB1604_47950 [Mycobacterium marinum]CDM79587.1 hypothetical protein MMARE11_p00850 [Mycobacterium marinum E11]
MLLMPVPADRFDEVRRKWIARNQRTFAFQKRRAEELARQIRDRDTVDTGARVDPADDDIIHPWYARPTNTPYAMFDWLLFMVGAVVAPLAWPAGKAMSVYVVQLIPSELRSYPVAAFMWAAAVVGLPLPLLYEPGDSLMSAAVVVWLVAQIPAALLMAGVYGILEGWLAVDGARDWWPMRPPEEVDDVDFGFLQSNDLTGPGVFPTRRDDPPGDASPIRRL